MNVMETINTKSPLLPDLIIPGEAEEKKAEEDAAEYEKLLESLPETRRLDAPAFFRGRVQTLTEDGRLVETGTLAPFVSAYQLLPEVKRALKELARPDCNFCNGSGVNRWRLGGRACNTCNCTRRG